MAKVKKNGIFDGLRGRVGNMVYFRRNGQTYARKLPGPRTKPPSAAQIAQGAKFKLVSVFIATIKELAQITFSNCAKNMSGANYATSYVSKHALKGEYPNIEIDYSKVLVSDGDVERARDGKVSCNKPGRIDFSWRDNSGRYMSLGTDRSIMVAHCASLNKTVFTTLGSPRDFGFGHLYVPEFSGFEVHTWLAFATENQRKFSLSVYTGKIAVAGS